MTEIARVKRKMEEGIELGVAGTPLDVLVMGPGLSEATPGAELRKKIIEAAEGYGAAIKPEHDDLISAAAALFGKGHHLTAYETQLAEVSDLLILIPASAGSLCELGLFSGSSRFGSKLLILQSKEYARSGSYVADGPLKAAKHHRAEVRYVDYGDFDRTWDIVKTRLDQARVRHYMDSIFGDPR